MDTLPVFFSHRFPAFAHEKSLFFRQGDYWVIGYRTAVAFLKATRGLQDLALLLGNPGREFHVCELAGRGIGKALSLGKAERADHASQDGLLSDVGPILDAQAKDEYKRRLDDLLNRLVYCERNAHAPPCPSETKAQSSESVKPFPRSAAISPPGSEPDISAPTVRTRSVRWRGNFDSSHVFRKWKVTL